MENFEKYAECTKAANWEDLCKLNDVSLDSFGTKKELKALPQYLEPDEVVFALTSGIMSKTETSNSFDFGSNTWLVVLTSDRFLFLDAAMLSNSVDTQSVRHDHVQAVSASQGIILGKIIVDLGSRTLVIDNCQKATVKVMANIANKWIKEFSEKKNANAKTLGLPSQTPLLDLLENIHKMISGENLDFNAQKEHFEKEFIIKALKTFKDEYQGILKNLKLRKKKFYPLNFDLLIQIYYYNSLSIFQDAANLSLQ